MGMSITLNSAFYRVIPSGLPDSTHTTSVTFRLALLTPFSHPAPPQGSFVYLRQLVFLLLVPRLWFSAEVILLEVLSLLFLGVGMLR